MAKLPPEFNDLNEESYGDQMKVTETLLKSTGKNTMWAKQQIEDLWDTTDPEIRKRFTPVVSNDEDSYGMILDEGQNIFKFSDQTRFDLDEHFVLDTQLDKARTTVALDAYGQNVKIPGALGAAVMDAKSANSMSAGVNTYYYAGWKRTSQYKIKSAVLKNPLGATIPSVARAQTFRPTVSGKLETIMVKLHANPRTEGKTYLELRRVVNGKPTSTVLAREEIPIKKMAAAAWYAVKFPNPPIVTSGADYAWIVRSPLTSYSHHVGVAGWTSHCKSDKYPLGRALTSYDNCKTWVFHGYDDNKVPYREGRYRPIDFAFITYVQSLATQYVINTDYFCYWKPMKTNPITAVKIDADYSLGTGGSIVFQYSIDNVNWVTIEPDVTAPLSEPYPKMIWFRAKLRTSSAGSTPTLTHFTAELTTTPAIDGYLLTEFYNPRLTMPLGASIWSGVGAPVDLAPDTFARVEIIRNTVQVDHFIGDGTTDTFNLNEFPAEPMEYCLVTDDAGHIYERYEGQHYTMDYDNKTITFREGFIPPELTIPDYNVQLEYYPLFLKNILQSELPIKLDFMEETFTGDGVTTDFIVRALPADPIRRVTLTDTDDNTTVQIEDEDFIVDYDTKTIKFNTAPSENYVIEIGYTPYLVETGVALAYRLERDNTDIATQVAVKPNYFQYRV